MGVQILDNRGYQFNANANSIITLNRCKMSIDDGAENWLNISARELQ